MENNIQKPSTDASKKKRTIFAVAAIGVTVGLGIVTMLASPARAWKVSGPNGMLLVNDYYDGIEIDLSKVKDAKITVPDNIDGVPVVDVSGGAYNHSHIFNDNLMSVTIPDTVTEIGGFYKYPLSSIELPENLRWIDSEAFECSYLREITLPAECSVGGSAFKGCSYLEDVHISDGIEKIVYHCFEDCTSLKDIELPDSVEIIEECAFAGCTSLENVDLNSVVSIREGAFENCISLKEIEIPDSVTNINSGAFKGCTALETITIPASVKHLDNSVFEDCTSLKAVFVSYDTEIDTETLATWHFAVKRY